MKKLFAAFFTFTGIVTGILLMQTFLVLPQLTQRAEHIIAGNYPGELKVYLLFGIAAVIKVLTLLYLGFHTKILAVNSE